MSQDIIKDKDDPQISILGILTVFKLGFNDMAFISPHSTTHQLQLLCLIFQPYTQDHFHILEERTSRTYARCVCTQCSTCFNTSPDLILIFLCNKQSISLYRNSAWARQCPFSCPPYPIPPLTLTDTLLSFSFYP